MKNRHKAERKKFFERLRSKCDAKLCSRRNTKQEVEVILNTFDGMNACSGTTIDCVRQAMPSVEKQAKTTHSVATERQRKTDTNNKHQAIYHAASDQPSTNVHTRTTTTNVLTTNVYIETEPGIYSASFTRSPVC